MQSKTAHIVCASSGLITMLVTGIGLAVAGFLPVVPSPVLGAEQVAMMFRDHVVGIRIGMIFICGAAGTFLMFSAAISAQLRRIENGSPPLFSYLSLAAGTATSFLFLIPSMFWTAAVFRPERAFEITQMLGDVASLFYLMTYSISALHAFAIGFAIYSDKNPTPIFPRLAGHINIGLAVSYLPAGFAGTYKTGPLAWDGFLSWWLVLFTYTVWLLGMTYYLIKAINTPDIPDGTRALA